jgi:hypothetical protein
MLILGPLRLVPQCKYLSGARLWLMADEFNFIAISGMIEFAMIASLSRYENWNPSDEL